MLHAFVRHLVKALVIYDHEKKGILKLYSRDNMPLKIIVYVILLCFYTFKSIANANLTLVTASLDAAYPPVWLNVYFTERQAALC